MGVGRVAGLDGLRGIAVAVVVVFHLGRLQGGFLGVDLFFVLSGFLITSLLLGEVASTGRVGLGGFWARRARRLLPALLLVMAGIGGLLFWLTPSAERALFRNEGLATLGYAANWQRALSPRSYWDMFAQPSPFDHMWSLAIEEQFYVGWPLVLLAVTWAARRRGADVARSAGFVAGAGAVVSLVWLALAYDPLDTNWAYFSTPTRLGPVLAGCALAAFMPRGVGGGHGRSAVTVGGVVGLGVIAGLVVAIEGTGAGYYRGGLVAFTVASLVVVGSVVRRPDGPLARALSFTPLRLLGLVSYGVYLWHWPVIVFLTPERAHVDGVALDLLRVVVVLAAAGVSYWVVERPVRRGLPAGRRLFVAGPAAVAACLIATVVGTTGTPRPQFSDIPNGPLAGTDTIFLHVPASVPAGAPRVLLVGDSGAQFLGPELVDVGDEQGVAVAFSSEVACTPVVPEGMTLRPDGDIERHEPCQQHRLTLWERLVEEFDPDVVVYYIANAGALNKVRLDGEWVWDCDPAYDAYIARTLRSDAEMLGAGGASVVFTTAPYIAVIDRRSADRTDCRNQLVHDVAAAGANTSVVDLQGFVRDEGGFAEGMFVDSLHFSPEGGQLVSRWLLPLVMLSVK